MQRMKATQWRRQYFAAGGAPSQPFINEQIKSGELPGETIGSLCFIHVYDGTIEPCYDPLKTNTPQTKDQIEADILLRGYLHDAKTA